MKEILSGNEAIARGAYEAGVRVAVAYPGTPSTEVLESMEQYPSIYAQWSPNEKVALEVGIGASFAGARVLVAMKHVGLNVAADPWFTLAYTGVNGGLILVSADDPGMHSSQNEQDNRYFARMAHVPLLEPSDSQEAKDFVAIGLEIGETYDTPVMLRTTTRISHSKGLVNLGEREEVPLKPYERDAQKYVMIPAYGRLRHQAVEERLARLQALAEETPLNRLEWGERKIGIITSGVVYQYVKEVFPEASILKLGLSYPLPEGKIKELAAGVDKLYVVEELEPFLEEQIKALGIPVEGKKLTGRRGELSPARLREVFGLTTPDQGTNPAPSRPPVLCPGCPHRGVFYVLNRLKLTVSGDIGCYTLGSLPPLSAMDACVCMGASIGMAHGMEKANPQFAGKTVAVIGDSTFLHSGITPLMDVAYNGGNTTVLILDNSTTAMTGHQDHPASGKTLKGQPAPKVDLEGLVRSLQIRRVTKVDAYDLAAVERAVKEEMAQEEPSVIIVERACALIVDREQPYRIDPEQCTNCRLCLRIGCPAISGHGTMDLDASLCNGCGVCAQICPRGAIVKVGEGDV
ncbi:MAG: indolepyruvate ferredoxin oxidoreductase subunit alpha [Limnochordia bacterium]